MRNLKPNWAAARNLEKRRVNLSCKKTLSLLYGLASLFRGSSALNYLPDPGGHIFDGQLSVTMSGDEPETSDMIAAMLSSTRIVSGDPDNVFLTEFGFDKHNHSYPSLCSIDPTTFDWESSSYASPMDLTMNLQSFNNGWTRFATSLNFLSGSSPLGVHSTCGVTPAGRIDSVDISSGINLMFLFTSSAHSTGNVQYPFLVDVNGEYGISPYNSYSQTNVAITFSHPDLVFLGTQIKHAEYTNELETNIVGIYYKKNGKCVDLLSFASSVVSESITVSEGAKQVTIMALDQETALSFCADVNWQISETTSTAQTSLTTQIGQAPLILDASVNPTTIDIAALPVSVSSGSYTFSITATSSTDSSVTASHTIVLVVTNDICAAASLTILSLTADPAPFDYSGLLQATVLFTLDIPQCSSSQITYTCSATPTLPSGGSLCNQSDLFGNQLSQFDPSTSTFEMDGTLMTRATVAQIPSGIYTVTIEGSLTGSIVLQSSHSIPVQIVDPCQNTSLSVTSENDLLIYTDNLAFADTSFTTDHMAFTPIEVTTELTDSVSFARAPFDGVTYCGTRQYTLLSPSPVPAWLTLDASTGITSINLIEGAFIHDLANTIQVEGSLVDFTSLTPAISEFTVTFSLSEEAKCVTEFHVDLFEWAVAELESRQFIVQIEDESSIMFDLSTLAEANFVQEGFDCGEIGYQLLDVTQESFLTFDQVDFVVEIKTITDEALVGTHLVQFEAFLKDLDPDRVFARPLDFSVELQIEKVPEVDLEQTFVFGEILSKQPPVSVDSIAPSYLTHFGETQWISFTFADPLYLNKTEEGDIKGILIKFQPNEQLPEVVTKSSIEILAVGLGKITLRIDGQAAKESMANQNQSYDELTMMVQIEVQDLGTEELTSLFEIRLSFIEPETEPAPAKGEETEAEKRAREIKEKVDKWRTSSLQLIKLGEGTTGVAPTPKISFIESSGEFEITFDKEMRVLPSLDILMEGKVERNGIVYPVLEVEVIPHFDSDLSNLRFNWEVSTMTKRYVRFKLVFETAVYVSMQEGPDILRTTFRDPLMFIGVNNLAITKEPKSQNRRQLSEEEAEENDLIILLRDMPPQFQLDGFDAALSDAFDQVISATQVTFVSNFAINTAIGASLNQIWSMINTQQMIVMLPLFTIVLPANARSFFAKVMTIAAFDFYESSDVVHETFAIPEAKNMNPNFDADGFESKYFLVNMGTLALFWLILMALTLLYLILKPCSCAVRLSSKIKIWLYWGSFFTLINESFMIVIVCLLINIQVLSFETVGLAVMSALCITFLVVYVGLPAILIAHISYNFKSLTDKVWLRIYHKIYSELRLGTGKWVLWQPSFFLIRRFMIGVAVCLVGGVFIWQLLIVTSTIIIQVTIIGAGYFSSKGKTMTELFNEAVLMFSVYAILAYTPWVQDVHLKSQVGNASISIVVIHLVVSLILIIASTLINSRWKYKKWSVIRNHRVYRNDLRSYLKESQKRRRNLRRAKRVPIETRTVILSLSTNTEVAQKRDSHLPASAAASDVSTAAIQTETDSMQKLGTSFKAGKALVDQKKSKLARDLYFYEQQLAYFSYKSKPMASPTKKAQTSIMGTQMTPEPPSFTSDEKLLPKNQVCDEQLLVQQSLTLVKQKDSQSSNETVNDQQMLVPSRYYQHQAPSMNNDPYQLVPHFQVQNQGLQMVAPDQETSQWQALNWQAQNQFAPQWWQAQNQHAAPQWQPQNQFAQNWSNPHNQVPSFEAVNKEATSWHAQRQSRRSPMLIEEKKENGPPQQQSYFTSYNSYHQQAQPRSRYYY